MSWRIAIAALALSGCQMALPSAPDAPRDRCLPAGDSAYAAGLRVAGQTLYACPAGTGLIGGTKVGEQGGVVYYNAP